MILQLKKTFLIGLTFCIVSHSSDWANVAHTASLPSYWHTSVSDLPHRIQQEALGAMALSFTQRLRNHLNGSPFFFGLFMTWSWHPIVTTIAVLGTRGFMILSDWSIRDVVIAFYSTALLACAALMRSAQDSPEDLKDLDDLRVLDAPIPGDPNYFVKVLSDSSIRQQTMIERLEILFQNSNPRTLREFLDNLPDDVPEGIKRKIVNAAILQLPLQQPLENDDEPRMVEPKDSIRVPAAIALLTAGPSYTLQQVMDELSHGPRGPAFYWSGTEIARALERSGQEVNRRHLMIHLDREHREGRLDRIQIRQIYYYRQHWEDPESKEEAWHGIPWSQIAESAEFYGRGDDHLLAFIRQRDGLIPSVWASRQALVQISQELLEAYTLLRESERPLSAAELLERLKAKRGNSLLFRNKQELDYGLKWLDGRGFAIRRHGQAEGGALWSVDGVAKTRMLDLEFTRWPANWWSDPWIALQEDLSVMRDPQPEEPQPWERMQERFELFLDVHRLGKGDIVPPTESKGGAYDSLAKRKTTYFLDSALDVRSTRLGIEPAILRYGQYRTVALAQVLKDPRLPTLTIGQRIRLFREIAGLSRAELTSLLDLPEGALRRVEEENFGLGVEFFPKLENILDVDALVLITGLPPRQAFASLQTPEERIELALWARGMGISKLLTISRNWRNETQVWHSGIRPRASFRQGLTELLRVPDELLFGPMTGFTAMEDVSRLRRPPAGGPGQVQISHLAIELKNADSLSALAAIVKRRERQRNLSAQDLYIHNRPLMAQVVVALAAQKLMCPAGSIGMEELLTLLDPDYDNVLVVLGTTLKNLFRFFARNSTLRGLPTRYRIVAELFPHFPLPFHPVNHCYTLADVRQLIRYGIVPNQIDEFWKILPASAQRALLYENVRRLPDRNLDNEWPSKQNFKKTPSPSLKRSLKGMIIFYDNNLENLLSGVGFVRDEAAIRARLESIRQGFEAIQTLQTVDRPWAKDLAEGSRQLTGSTQRDLRRLLEALLRSADSIEDAEFGNLVSIGRRGIEDCWSMLDSIEMMPETFREVRRVALTREPTLIRPLESVIGRNHPLLIKILDGKVDPFRFGDPELHQPAIEGRLTGRLWLALDHSWTETQVLEHEEALWLAGAIDSRDPTPLLGSLDARYQLSQPFQGLPLEGKARGLLVPGVREAVSLGILSLQFWNALPESSQNTQAAFIVHDLEALGVLEIAGSQQFRLTEPFARNFVSASSHPKTVNAPAPVDSNEKSTLARWTQSDELTLVDPSGNPMRVGDIRLLDGSLFKITSVTIDPNGHPHAWASAAGGMVIQELSENDIRRSRPGPPVSTSAPDDNKPNSRLLKTGT